MTNHSLLARPAQSAIAAALVLCSTPLLAQTTPPVTPNPESSSGDAPPPLVVQTTNSAPASGSPTADVIFAPSTPVVQAVPPVSAVAPADETDPSTLTAEEGAPARRADKSEARRADPSAAIANPARNPATTVIPEPTDNRITATPAVKITPAGSQSQPALLAARSPSDNDEEQFAMIGLGLGAIALLFGGALVALRRRPADEGEAQRPSSEPHYASEPHVSPIDPMQETTAFPPLGAHSKISAHSALPASPAMPEGDDRTRREAMVAQAPDRTNPFLTRKNRLRRASFLLRQEASALFAATDIVQPVRSEASSAVLPPQRTMQISFGKRSVSSPLRPLVFKPGLS